MDTYRDINYVYEFKLSTHDPAPTYSAHAINDLGQFVG